jgi:hypothetical protein
MSLTGQQLHAIGLFITQPEKSKEEVAQRLGVSRRTLYNWLEKDDFRNALQRTPEEHIKSALWLKAVQGDSTAAAKWIQFYGEKRDEGGLHGEMFSVSPEELEHVRRSIYEHYKSLEEQAVVEGT